MKTRTTFRTAFGALFGLGLALGLSVTATAQQRPTFATRLSPQVFTSGTLVTIGGGIDDVRNVKLASRNCFFFVGIGLVRTPSGPQVSPPILIGAQPFQPAGRTGAAAKLQIRVPRLPAGIGLTLYFQNVALLSTRAGTARWLSTPARGLLRT